MLPTSDLSVIECILSTFLQCIRKEIEKGMQCIPFSQTSNKHSQIVSIVEQSLVAASALSSMKESYNVTSDLRSPNPLSGRGVNCYTLLSRSNLHF